MSGKMSQGWGTAMMALNQDCVNVCDDCALLRHHGSVRYGRNLTCDICGEESLMLHPELRLYHRPLKSVVRGAFFWGPGYKPGQVTPHGETNAIADRWLDVDDTVFVVRPTSWWQLRAWWRVLRALRSLGPSTLTVEPYDGPQLAKPENEAR